MPDKHSNNKPSVSEELIRQYLAGELDDKAMHALERQALDDPFLAEALEGYAAHEPDQSAQLAELQQRLEQRVGQSEKGRLRLLYYRWASAAAILVILGLSFLWINRQQSAEHQRNIAKRDVPPQATYKAPQAAEGKDTVQTPPPPTAGVSTPAETLIAKTDAPVLARKALAPPAAAPALSKAAKEEPAQPEAVAQEDKAAEAALADVKALAPAPAAIARMADTINNDTQGFIAANSQPRLNEVLQGRAAGVSVSRAKRSRKQDNSASYSFNPSRIIKARRIVVLGSSTAAGTGPKTPDSAWVNLLRNYLQLKDPATLVTNLAVGGYTSYKLLPQGADVPFTKPDPDPEHNIDKALSLQPDLIIINLPSNDITEGFSVSEFQHNLSTVIGIIRRHNIRYYITTTQPRNTTPENRAMLRQMRDIIISSYP
ncbi:MAG TPA: SGNH/GDSL hydrolase family protein, partial [Chitinophaga sp.]